MSLSVFNFSLRLYILCEGQKDKVVVDNNMTGVVVEEVAVAVAVVVPESHEEFVYLTQV
jgi:hypothetical protein